MSRGVAPAPVSTTRSPAGSRKLVSGAIFSSKLSASRDGTQSSLSERGVLSPKSNPVRIVKIPGPATTNGLYSDSDADRPVCKARQAEREAAMRHKHAAGWKQRNNRDETPHKHCTARAPTAV